MKSRRQFLGAGAMLASSAFMKSGLGNLRQPQSHLADASLIEIDVLDHGRQQFAVIKLDEQGRGVWFNPGNDICDDRGPQMLLRQCDYEQLEDFAHHSDFIEVDSHGRGIWFDPGPNIRDDRGPQMLLHQCNLARLKNVDGVLRVS